MDKEDVKNIENAENADIAGLAEKVIFLPDDIYTDLPEPLHEIVSGFTERERDIIFLSSVVVLSFGMPKIFGIHDRTKYNPDLFLFLVALPVNGKGVISWSKILIEHIHDKILKDSKQAKRYKKLENKENIVNLIKCVISFRYV